MMNESSNAIRFVRTVMVAMMCLIGTVASAQTQSDVDRQKVTLHIRNAFLPAVLEAIEKQTGVTFSYESSLVKELPKISFQADDEALPECLARLFASLPMVYKMTGSIVILKRKPSQVTISGFVRDQTSAESLIGASVYETSSRKGTAANNYGFFSITLPAGDIDLQASYIGYGSRRLNLTSQERDTTVTIELIPNTYLDEVIVLASGPEKQAVLSTQMGVMEINQQTIRSTPVLFGESDLIKTLQLTPGVAAGTEGIAGMYVRGGNIDENLFLIDGNPVYQINHLGGIFSAFNPEAVRGMDFYKAGFPSRYGGRLSSVVDVHTKEGNMKEYHGSASVGLISGNLNLEGPIIKDRTSFHIALRRTWLDVLTSPAIAIANKKQKKDGFRLRARYAFHDLNLKVNHRFSDRSRMFVSLYNGNDVLKAGGTDFPSESNDGIRYKEDTNASLRWGNLMATAGWTYVFNNRLFGKISGVYTQYNSNMSNAYEYTQGEAKADGYIRNYSKTESRTGIMDVGLRSSFDYLPATAHHIRFGADYLLHRFRPEYSRMQFKDEDSDGQTGMDNVFADDQLWASECAVFAEDDWTLTPTVRLNAGLRFSLFSVENKTYASPEPRLSLRWLLTDALSFKSSYARMNQYVHLISNSYLNLPTDAWMPVTKRLKPLVSDQVSAGFYYNLNNQYDFSVEGYYKKMNNLLEYKDGSSFMPSFASWEDKMTVGSGRGYGVELMVRKDTGRLTGWVGYSLSWADRYFADLNKGVRFPARYDNRHKLNIVAMYKLSPRVELSAAWTYASGNHQTLSLEEYEGPTTPEIGGNTHVELFDARNNYQLPAYHRLDLGINIYRPKKKGRMGIWNISIYNAYCRMNPFLVYKSSDRVRDVSGQYTSVPHFKKLGFMPIIPSITYTYKF